MASIYQWPGLPLIGYVENLVQVKATAGELRQERVGEGNGVSTGTDELIRLPIVNAGLIGVTPLGDPLELLIWNRSRFKHKETKTYELVG